MKYNKKNAAAAKAAQEVKASRKAAIAESKAIAEYFALQNERKEKSKVVARANAAAELAKQQPETAKVTIKIVTYAAEAKSKENLAKAREVKTSNQAFKAMAAKAEAGETCYFGNFKVTKRGN